MESGRQIIFLIIVIGCHIQVNAYVCEVGQEKNGIDVWSWVLPYAEPCECTSVRLGGMNTWTPTRPFKPVYVDKPLLSNDILKIRAHYGLNCKEETTQVEENTLGPLSYFTHDKTISQVEESSRTHSFYSGETNPTTQEDMGTTSLLSSFSNQATTQRDTGIHTTPPSPTDEATTQGDMGTTSHSGVMNPVSSSPSSAQDKATARVETTTAAKNCTSRALGLQDGVILDAQMTSSSFYTTTYYNERKQYYARLHNSSWWVPSTSDSTPWMEINLETVHMVCGIITQGFPIYWVETFYLRYTQPTGVWLNVTNKQGDNKLFTANNATAVTNMLDIPIDTSAIQLHPQQCTPNRNWPIGLCRLKMELLECDANG